MALIKYCEGCRFEGRSMSSHPCNACMFGSRHEAPARVADMKVKQIEGKKSCDNCRFRNKKLYEEPCVDCTNEDQWEPRVKDGLDAGVIMTDEKIAFNVGGVDVMSIYPHTTIDYSRADAVSTADLLEAIMCRKKERAMKPYITNVIFNDPATIVFWSDHTKTVVKCQDGDLFDAEKGLAMAISKKYFGNRGRYCEEFKKWLPEEEEVDYDALAERMTRVYALPAKVVKGIIDGVRFGNEKEK